jgi:hypothetical protein
MMMMFLITQLQTPALPPEVVMVTDHPLPGTRFSVFERTEEVKEIRAMCAAIGADFIPLGNDRWIVDDRQASGPDLRRRNLEWLKKYLTGHESRLKKAFEVTELAEIARDAGGLSEFELVSNAPVQIGTMTRVKLSAGGREIIVDLNSTDTSPELYRQPATRHNPKGGLGKSRAVPRFGVSAQIVRIRNSARLGSEQTLELFRTLSEIDAQAMKTIQKEEAEWLKKARNASGKPMNPLELTAEEKVKLELHLEQQYERYGFQSVSEARAFFINAKVADRHSKVQFIMGHDAGSLPTAVGIIP